MADVLVSHVDSITTTIWNSVRRNPFTSGQGYTYDAAGNVLTDAEGRLRSAGSTYFLIPEPIAKSQELYIGFKYEWEIIGSAGFESYSPTHRVYFTLDQVSDCS
ncbi:MAG: hypothetical protein IPK58_18465 [Acidobacteria bacterium]|nr:hypothetical protein [Acidobacteriota bacterium]